MEGFKPDEYDKILDLPAKRLTSVVCCAAGYRSADDKKAGQKKVRFSRNDVIHIVRISTSSPCALKSRHLPASALYRADNQVLALNLWAMLAFGHEYKPRTRNRL